MSLKKHKDCLVLNADYSPLTIIDHKKAILCLYKNNSLEIIEFYSDDYLIGVEYKVFIPAVIRIKQYLSSNNWSVKFSKNNLLIRDNFICQYCGKSMDKKSVTYDHIIPRSQWKKRSCATNWTNIVSACLNCNHKKGNKTPEQAHMKLINIPIIPTKNKKYLSVTRILSNINNHLPEEWINYIQ